MTVGGCEDDLQAELPALLSALHAGDVVAVHVSHQVDATGDCRLTVEVTRPDGETARDKQWEYRWP